MPAPEVTMANLREAKLSSRKKTWKELRKPKDRFGRSYVIWVDAENKDPVGTIERQFTAPVDLPDKFMHIDRERPWRLELDFASYIRELQRADTEWHQTARFHMKRLYGDKGMEGEYTPAALELAGPKPQDWRVVEMARRGDPWALGITPHRTPAIVALIGQDPFIAQQKVGTPAQEFSLGAEFEERFGRHVGKAVKQGFADEDDDREADEYRRSQAHLLEQAEAGEIVDGGAKGSLDREYTAADFAEDDELAANLSTEFGDLVDGSAAAPKEMSAELAADLEESYDPGATGGQRVAVSRGKRGAGTPPKER